MKMVMPWSCVFSVSDPWFRFRRSCRIAEDSFATNMHNYLYNVSFIFNLDLSAKLKNWILRIRKNELMLWAMTSIGSFNYGIFFIW